MRSTKVLAICICVTAAACSTDPALLTTTTAAVAPATTASTTTSTTTTAPATTSTTAATTTTTTLPPLDTLAYEIVAEGLSHPLLLVQPPGSDDLLVVERAGTVMWLAKDGSGVGDVFLDITERVADNGIEQGLLGLAFHPRFEANGRLFAYYVGNDDNSRLVEYSADATGPVDPDTETVLLHLDQAILRHYGGMVQFGPDGYLWVSAGEGGAASIHSQDPSTLLSSLLRLDVDSASPYAVPADNPFVDGGGAGEVWAYGLRNPWRFAFDPETEHVFIADVGHESWEEIDVVDMDGAPYNFGWVRMEGSHCFQRGCDAEAEGLTLPVYEYSHDEGCSITGGFPYRGAAIPEMAGHYFFSDWCSGFLRTYDPASGEVSDWTDAVGVIGQVNGFGLDGEGELYVLTWEGEAARIVPVRESG